jgi:RimJ/RimL family protein N-acetyltransferase
MPRHAAPNIAAPLGDKETARLVLRRFEVSDLDALSVVFAKPEVWQFPYGRAFTRAETAAFLQIQMREWEECGFGCWIAIEKAAQRVIGYVGISVPHFLPEILPAVEVGWRFDPDVWGRGYATEGGGAALDEAFTTLGLEAVCSAPQSINPPSSRVCDRLGMRFERVVTAPATPRREAVERKPLLDYERGMVAPRTQRVTVLGENRNHTGAQSPNRFASYRVVTCLGQGLRQSSARSASQAKRASRVKCQSVHSA